MGILRRFSFVLVALVAAVAITPHASAATTVEQDAARYLFSLVNADRQAAHIGTLNEHAYIGTQTDAHSQDMLDRHHMDHNGFPDRVANIRAHEPQMKDSGMCENVAAASKFADYGAAMRAVDEGWNKSKEHFDCMYDKEGWSSQSAAVSVRYDGKTFWVTFIAAHDPDTSHDSEDPPLAPILADLAALPGTAL